MGCDRTVGSVTSILTLMLGLVLTTAAIASPLWRMVDTPDYSRHRGLWQECVYSGNSDDGCRFCPGQSVLWRAIQAVQLASLFLLLCALVGSLTSIVSSAGRCGQRRCRARPCPVSSVAALLAGLSGLVGDLLYVGYVEGHADLLPGEHLYAWSFAFSVAGSFLALLAFPVLCVADRFISPPYRHFNSVWRPPFGSRKQYMVNRASDPRTYPHPRPHNIRRSAESRKGAWWSSADSVWRQYQQQPVSLMMIDPQSGFFDRRIRSNPGSSSGNSLASEACRRWREKLERSRQHHGDYAKDAVSDCTNIGKLYNHNAAKPQRRHSIEGVFSSRPDCPGEGAPRRHSDSACDERRGVLAGPSHRAPTRQLCPQSLPVDCGSKMLGHQAARRHVKFKDAEPLFTIYKAVDEDGLSGMQTTGSPAMIYKIVSELCPSETRGPEQ